MGGKREWFKHDAWFLADDKIRDLGHEFGPQGPLLANALMQLAKRQKKGGLVTAKVAYLREHAFCKSLKDTRAIINACAANGFVHILDDAGGEVTVFLMKWRDIQGGGLSGAERTALWRDKQVTPNVVVGDADVTSQERDGDVSGVSPSRAGAQEVETEEAKASSSSKERDKATDDDRRLCRYLAVEGTKLNPKFKVKSDTAWLRDMRLLRERDGNTPDEIDRLLRWLFTDTGRDATFWAKVIQSPGNLREHFAQLWGKMIAQPSEVSAAANVESVDSYLTRRGAA